VLCQGGERNDLQGELVRGCEHHVGGGAVEVGTQPVSGGYAPAVAGDQAREAVLRYRRTEVVADPALMLEKLGRHHGADGVAALVLDTGAAAPVAIKAGDGVGATALERPTEHVTVDHCASIAYRTMPERSVGGSVAAPRLITMSFLGGPRGSLGGDSDLGALAVTAHVEERRATRSDRLCAGTLACGRCDAPIAIGAEPLLLTDRLTCPFCRHDAPARDFLSLASPTRPARVVVCVSRPVNQSGH
jgi:hypothetical protein